MFWVKPGTCPQRTRSGPPLFEHTRETVKCLGSGGSMVARLKLKGIDGRAPPGVEFAA